MKKIKNACCFLGHRKVLEAEKIKQKARIVIEMLIIEKNVNTFLFGSRSEFDSICYDIVTELKSKYSNIERVYIRAEYPFIDEIYKKYLLEKYEYTYYPSKILGATKSVYIKRNFEMIDQSEFCVIYLEDKYIPQKGTSGTKTGYKYAVKENKIIYRLSTNI